MSGRKTIEVEYLRGAANRMLAESPKGHMLERKGIAALLEDALHRAGRYQGYQYLEIEWETIDTEDGLAQSVKSYGDQTRRRYL